MATREFVAVTWSGGQMVDEQSMDQINNNLIYLRNQSVNGKYMHLNNGVTAIGIKLLCGRKLIASPNSDTVTARVGFAQQFDAGTIPVVTTSITSPSGKVKIFHTINGVNGDQPNHQGFEVKVNVAADSEKQDKLTKPIYLNWIAMGYGS